MRYDAPLILIILAGCSAATEPGLGDEFRLRTGERARIAGTAVTITFAGVAEDSRCPSRAQCVWPGDGAAVLNLDTFLNDIPVEDTLHTNPQFERVGGGLGLEIVLVELAPYPEVPGSINPEDYVVTLLARQAP